MRTVFTVRASTSTHSGDDRIEERINDRLANALEPEMSVLTIGRQYFCEHPDCAREHDVSSSDPADHGTAP